MKLGNNVSTNKIKNCVYFGRDYGPGSFNVHYPYSSKQYDLKRNNEMDNNKKTIHIIYNLSHKYNYTRPCFTMIDDGKMMTEITHVGETTIDNISEQMRQIVHCLKIKKKCYYKT